MQTIQLSCLAQENVGGKDLKGDNQSHKTGITSMKTKATEFDDQYSIKNFPSSNEKVAIDFLKKQNTTQLDQIKDL